MDVTNTSAALGPRERGRLETRARLLDSARSLFSERGLLKVTSHDIAHGAGVAAGTFYLHFPDKQALFREIVYEAIATLRSRLQVSMDTAPDARSAVVAHADALICFAEEHSDMVRIVFSRGHGDTELESDVLDNLATVGAEMLRKRMTEGRFRSTLDPQVAAQALTGMFTRVIVWWIEDPSRASRESVLRTLIDIQLGGTQPQ